MDPSGRVRSLRERWRRLARRLRRIERRELREFQAWLETTRNLLHLSVLVVVPLVIAAVTAVSNTVEAVSFLLYPPLAAGAYTLFADPAGRYASPVRFVAGLTAGAACGVVALRVALVVGGTGPGVSPLGAALAVFLAGAVTWAGGVEEPAAFSAALLALVTRSSGLQYVVSIALSSLIVAVAFVAWRRGLYEERARYLYRSVRGDDHVLVPMRGPAPGATAALAARLAAAHDAGKVVLLALVRPGDVESARRAAERAREQRPDADLATEAAVKGAESLDTGVALPDGGAGDGPRGGTADGGQTATDGTGDDDAESRAAAALATALENRAADVQRTFGVPCEVVVSEAGGNEAATVLRIADEANCDLVATPFGDDGTDAQFVARLFRSGTDVLAHHSASDSVGWHRILVPVRSAGDQAHAMIDFAARLVRQAPGGDGDGAADGVVTLVTCIERERDRRRAEEMLADLSETVGVPVETAVARRRVEEYLSRHAGGYDLVVVGASRDRTAASRLVSPPTFRRLEAEGIEADLAVVDRNVRAWREE